MRLSAIIFAMATGIVASAQTWTLDSCINYAVEHNINVRNSELQSESGRLSVVQAKDRFLPNLSGYASQSFNFGRGLTANNTYANRNTSSFSVGAQLQLLLFQGLSAIRNLDYAKANLRALVEQTEATKDDVALNVTSQYLQALYAAEMVGVAEENLSISKNELARTRELLEGGKVPELDLYQVEAQVAQDELTLVNARNDSSIALLDLAQMLNLPSYEGFAISPLVEEKLTLVPADEVFANALARNHSMKAYELQVVAAEKNVSVAKAGYIPQLSFNAGIGTNYYKTSGYDNESFGGQMRHNFSKSIGFSLQVPLFDAFSTRNNVKRARINALTAQLQLDDTRMKLYKAITQAHAQAIAAMKKYEASQVSVSSTMKALEAMQIKYSNGRANATELQKAQSDYTKSLAETVQAKYEADLRIRIVNFYNK